MRVAPWRLSQRAPVPGVSMMRRVVVTGLGMVTPLASGVEPTWQRILAGQSGIRRIEKFEVSDISCKIAGQVPRGDGSDGTFNADHWMEPKEQRKVDDFIIFAMGAATQALDDADWHPSRYEDQIVSGVMIGSGIGGVEGIAETSLAVTRPRPAPRVAVLHSRAPDQSRLGLCVDHPWLEGSQPRRSHRLLDRGARHRRRRPADRAGRCRRDGGRRHGVAGQPHLARRLCRLPGAVDRIQRYARTRIAALRPRPRRFCDGRGRRRRGARRIRSRQDAAAPASTPS